MVARALPMLAAAAALALAADAGAQVFMDAPGAFADRARSGAARGQPSRPGTRPSARGDAYGTPGAARPPAMPRGPAGYSAVPSGAAGYPAAPPGPAGASALESRAGTTPAGSMAPTTPAGSPVPEDTQPGRGLALPGTEQPAETADSEEAASGAGEAGAGPSPYESAHGLPADALQAPEFQPLPPLTSRSGRADPSVPYDWQRPRLRSSSEDRPSSRSRPRYPDSVFPGSETGTESAPFGVSPSPTPADGEAGEQGPGQRPDPLRP